MLYLSYFIKMINTSKISYDSLNKSASINVKVDTLCYTLKLFHIIKRIYEVQMGLARILIYESREICEFQFLLYKFVESFIT